MTQAGNMLSQKLTRHVVATRALLNAISTACSRALLRDLFNFLESVLFRLWERLRMLVLVVLLVRLAIMEGHIVDGAVTVTALNACEDVAAVAVVDMAAIAAARKALAEVGVIFAERVPDNALFIPVVIITWESDRGYRLTARGAQVS
jgi:hypothetical protein